VKTKSCAIFFAVVFLFFSTGCSLFEDTATVHVSWDPVSDALANRDGGGYAVFCGNCDDFFVKRVPHRDGITPTSISIDVEKDQEWCFCVAGYFIDEDGNISYGQPSDIVCIDVKE